ncbi:glycosyltransferase family 4 protein [Roseinatronobacter sp.]|uniref:glycosyltransferase family 4 protein n=1 Tax=Roseinatronobacter sp. TaxID=1945755 RepID=UPI0025D091A6|nr:glycosyltransferase family 4 protein [Roseibaca sp.]
MHLLLTVNSNWNILNFRRPLVAALLSQGHRITVLAPMDDAVPELQKLGVRVVPLVMDMKGLNPLRDSAFMLRLYRHFLRERPDLILSWTIKNNIFGAFAARAVGVPFLPNVSGLGTAFLSGGALQRVAEMLYRLSFARLGTVFFQNTEDAALFVERGLVHERQVYCLPGSGIDLTHFTPAPLPEGPPGFLMIARLLRDKGVLEYVAAARDIRARYPDVTFRLLGAAGSQNRSAISADEVVKWQAEGVIDYLGTTDDVRPYIAQSQCIVLPSYREGAPRTLIEGAAMGRGAIATDVAGCRDVVVSGVTGLLCAPRSAEALAEQFVRFLNMPLDMRAAMGRAARARMENRYDERIVVRAYLEAISRAR